MGACGDEQWEGLNVSADRGRAMRPSLVLATFATSVAALLLGPAAVAHADETPQETISRLQGAIKYTVDSDLLFPPGGWQMSASGKQVIARMASKLAPGQQNKLLVAGYTDNAPIGPALRRQGVTSNEILSQKRADSVMQFLISQGVRPELVSAHGYGEADPVASNNTAAGRSQNRRVELTLAPTGG